MRRAPEAEAGGLLRLLLVWIRSVPADPSKLILLQPVDGRIGWAVKQWHVEKLPGQMA